MSTQPGPVDPVISISTALEPYVDVKRAASYLSVAVKTLNEWARLKKIPAYPWGTAGGRRGASNSVNWTSGCREE
jgi:hypothetical protein